MATVIRGDANGLDVLLNGRPNNVAHRAMVAQINDFDAVARELQIDGDDRAVMAVADRYDRQNPRCDPDLTRPQIRTLRAQPI